MFLACGSQDGSEAKIKNNGALISPFDTLEVEFDSKIMVKGLEVDADGPAVLVSTGNSSELKFVGKNKTKADLPYFDQNKELEIKLSNIKNDDDYTKDEDVFTFRTMRILDDIEGQSNNSKESAPDIDSIGTTIDPDKVSFAGILEHHIVGDRYNLNDFYRLELIGKDSVNIQFKALHADTKVELIGTKDSISWTAKKGDNKFEYYVSTDVHYDGDMKVSDPIQFYLKISDVAADNPPNPYSITIGVERK